ncbi:MAG: phosphoribosylanthranilate isomerase [Acidimicrobiaceae bacterium]|nr:phosphoribosylanthranilate isomerase [Acidimicrobiaceae bacterium]
MFVKICGTTSEGDALLAVALGADAVGFIFAPSRRQVSPMLVADIVKRLPPEILTVGVFRDESPQRVVTVAARAGVRAVQLHGRESAADFRWVHEHVRVMIRAFAAGDPEVAKASDYGADIVMLDNPNPGSGQTFDWGLAADVPVGERLMIAGGLTPENVGVAIAQVRPWGVDVASGVEREPGRKDPVKLRAFVANARRAAAEHESTSGPAAHGPYDWQQEDDWKRDNDAQPDIG